MDIQSYECIDETTSRAIEKGLREYNSKYAEINIKDFTVRFSYKDEIIGGALGHTYYDWLFLKWLWVHENFRNQGIGTRIMSKVEEIASARSCNGIHLDTFSFQAKEFYQKLGYDVFGNIENHPMQYEKYFLRKYLPKIK